MKPVRDRVGRTAGRPTARPPAEPRDTPAAIVNLLDQEVAKILVAPETRQRLLDEVTAGPGDLWQQRPRPPIFDLSAVRTELAH